LWILAFLQKENCRASKMQKHVWSVGAGAERVRRRDVMQIKKKAFARFQD
jgi:hypothetical protein